MTMKTRTSTPTAVHSHIWPLVEGPDVDARPDPGHDEQQQRDRYAAGSVILDSPSSSRTVAGSRSERSRTTTAAETPWASMNARAPRMWP